MNDWFDGDRGNALVDVVEMMSEGADVNLFRCVQSGALISVGMTRDGGAVSVTVTLDGKWRREYFHDANQLTLWSEQAAEAVAVSRGVDTAPATPPPTRRRAKR